MMFDRALSTWLGLDATEIEALKVHTVGAFRKKLLEAVKTDPKTLLARLSASSGLSEVRVAQAASLLTTAQVRALEPGVIRPHVRSLAFIALGVLFFASAFYARPEPAAANRRVALKPDRAIAPFVPIQADDMMLVDAAAGSFSAPEQVVGRYSAAALPAGTVLTEPALSASPLAELAQLSLVSIPVSNLPAALTARLPVRAAVVFSPKPQSGALVARFDVWVLAEERAGGTSRIVAALPGDDAERIGGLLGSTDAALVLKR